MACRHGVYEGAVCAHCGDPAQKRRELAERLWRAGIAASCLCGVVTMHEGADEAAIAAIERELAEQEGK